MPNYFWEQIDKLLDLVTMLFPIIFVLLILVFIGSVISVVKFNKKHNAKLRRLENHSEENRKCMEEQHKKHFPEE